MLDKAEILTEVSRNLTAGHVEAAKSVLSDHYPFEPIRSTRATLAPARSLKIFRRDGFRDRYAGQRLVFPGALLVMSQFMPEAFPYHLHWKMEATHFAYYELYPVLDHVLPVARGGSNDDGNLVTTSTVRNSAKANFTLEELGWTLLPGSVDAEWDGLTSWFRGTIKTHPELLNDNAIAKWYGTLDLA